jgi:hypothetical protein
LLLRFEIIIKRNSVKYTTFSKGEESCVSIAFSALTNGTVANVNIAAKHAAYITTGRGANVNAAAKPVMNYTNVRVASVAVAVKKTIIGSRQQTRTILAHTKY